ncbi:MAG TPA: ethanolamine utilization protein EutJ [bacterium]|nr:ethanolamine utilization protein EutJ [bacterium]HNT65265.1 ethanolamine utilization protein EutJ [bacterium]HOX86932.1 ethanolamine utilization protein EutJ [bacterium]HPG46263.1 ethanolamine utilization protein EutJ [bacterium]HPM98543.1 ethanolamine utilization protein EutJ [bacterium]
MSIVEQVNQQLRRVARIVNKVTPVTGAPPCRLGIDLGTADVVLIACDEGGNPHAAFLEWADVVRDGVVLDYFGAIHIVKKLVEKAERKLGCRFTSASTSYPPGTDPYACINVLKAANLELTGMRDEPSVVAQLLQIDHGAVVDIGGGTTGISVVQNGQVIYSADEPTGGRHVTLTLAGNRRISYEEAEAIKRGPDAAHILPIIQPVFEKMATIIKNHIAGYSVDQLYLSGGTCCFPGADQVFAAELPDLEVILPSEPLYLTPLAIAINQNTESSDART